MDDYLYTLIGWRLMFLSFFLFWWGGCVHNNKKKELHPHVGVLITPREQINVLHRLRIPLILYNKLFRFRICDGTCSNFAWSLPVSCGGIRASSRLPASEEPCLKKLAALRNFDEESVWVLPECVFSYSDAVSQSAFWAPGDKKQLWLWPHTVDNLCHDVFITR